MVCINDLKAEDIVGQQVNVIGFSGCYYGLTKYITFFIKVKQRVPEYLFFIWRERTDA